jgi:hypothetical protein
MSQEAHDYAQPEEDVSDNCIHLDFGPEVRCKKETKNINALLIVQMCDSMRSNVNKEN